MNEHDGFVVGVFLWAIVWTFVAWRMGKKRGREGVWILGLLLGWLGCLIILFMRPLRKDETSGVGVQLSQASRFERKGEWESALAIYERIAVLLDEPNAEYASNCASRLRERMAYEQANR